MHAPPTADLAALKSEYEASLHMQAELEQKQRTLWNTLTCISGAIQMLEEKKAEVSMYGTITQR